MGCSILCTSRQVTSLLTRPYNIIILKRGHNNMVLTGAHYIYILFMVIILITMIMKKDTIVPCILGVFLWGCSLKKHFWCYNSSV